MDAPGKIRTCDTRIRNPVLYPLSYGGDVPAYEGLLKEARRGLSRSYIVSCIVPTRELHLLRRRRTLRSVAATPRQTAHQGRQPRSSARRTWSARRA